MQTQAFIKEAQSLIRDLKDHKVVASVSDYDAAERAKVQLQKRLNQAFSGMQDPHRSNTYTPSAYKLRDAAINAGFDVHPDVSRAIQFYFDRGL